MSVCTRETARYTAEGRGLDQGTPSRCPARRTPRTLGIFIQSLESAKDKFCALAPRPPSLSPFYLKSRVAGVSIGGLCLRYDNDVIARNVMIAGTQQVRCARRWKDVLAILIFFPRISARFRRLGFDAGPGA